MHALGSVHEKLDVWIGVAPKSNWPTGHVELNFRVDPNNMCRAQLIQTSTSSCTQLGLLGSAHVNFDVWNGALDSYSTKQKHLELTIFYHSFNTAIAILPLSLRRLVCTTFYHVSIIFNIYALYQKAEYVNNSHNETLKVFNKYKMFFFSPLS